MFGVVPKALTATTSPSAAGSSAALCTEGTYGHGIGRRSGLYGSAILLDGAVGTGGNECLGLQAALVLDDADHAFAADHCTGRASLEASTVAFADSVLYTKTLLFFMR